jgi:hypothetical protein
LTLSKPQTYREFVFSPPIIFNNDLCSRPAAFVFAHEIVFFFFCLSPLGEREKEKKCV